MRKTTISAGGWFLIWFIGLMITIYCAACMAQFSFGEFFLDFSIEKLDYRIIKANKTTGKWVIMAGSLYTLLIMYAAASKRKWRIGEEHGSADWGDAQKIGHKYGSKTRDADKLFSRNVSISYEKEFAHRRNMLSVIIGGSGAGKTLFYAQPNIMQANTSFVVLDPKGEITANTAELMKKEGYDVKILDIKEPHRSLGYNPFNYIRNDDDVMRLVDILFNAADDGKDKVSGENPMWDGQAKNQLMSYIFYLYHFAPPEEQNFEMVMQLFNNDYLKEGVKNYVSPTGKLFERVEEQDPYHICVRYYNMYRKGAAKTVQSIIVTLAPRLRKFQLQSMCDLTRHDELNLSELGRKKQILYCIVPDDDESFNFIVSMLYTQLMQQLYNQADIKYQGRNPVHVHFLMDEFANVVLPENFKNLVATMRSRNISVSIILQTLSQLKSLYKDDWETIMGNCDELLYLGGNEQSTHKYVSELIGKQTLNTRDYNRSFGVHGSSGRSDREAGRELITPDEVRRMPDDDCILFIRGEPPVYDKKIDVWHHRNIKRVSQGGAKRYSHGNANFTKIKLDDLTQSLHYAATVDQSAVYQAAIGGTLCDADELLCLFKEEKNEG